MSWSYRIGHTEQGGAHTYGVVEFFEASHTWTGFVNPQGETVEELEKVLIQMIGDTYRYRDEPPIEIGGVDDDRTS